MNDFILNPAWCNMEDSMIEETNHLCKLCGHHIKNIDGAIATSNKHYWHADCFINQETYQQLKLFE